MTVNPQTHNPDRAALGRLVDVSRSFGAVKAVQDVSLDIHSGEVLAIVGENGAGKSTLMNILFGMLRPDRGRIEIGGQAVDFRSSRDAIAAGLGMVHQHFMLFPELSILENILVGAEKAGRGGLIDYRARRAEIETLIAEFGFSLPLDARVASLPVHARQQVEITKMLYREARLIILDEPTAVLTPHEKDGLFLMLRRLRDNGRAVVIITHKLDEVMEVSDRVVVMRAGRKIAETRTSTTTKQDISRAMIGHDIAPVPKIDLRQNRIVLEIKGLCVARNEGTVAVDNVSLGLSAGEVFGIAGVAGNGQKEFVEALVGLGPVASGRILLDGVDITHSNVGARRAQGLGFMAEDRMHVGLATDARIFENTIAGREATPLFSRKGWLLAGPARASGEQVIRDYDVMATGAMQRVADLSGGNKQKIIVGRELAASPRVIIAENPSWGVDIGAMAFIHERLLAAAEQGAGVLLVSSDLEELFALSDRVGVFYNGRISGIFNRDQLDAYRIGAVMAGQDGAAA